MPVRVLSRVEIAVEQLHIALASFTKNQSLVATLTLAGAAEELLAGALKAQGKRTALQHWYDNKVLSEPQLPWSRHAAEENFARNAVKHFGLAEDLYVQVDLREASAFMLWRACMNYESLAFVPTKRMRAFKRWFWRWAT